MKFQDFVGCIVRLVKDVHTRGGYTFKKGRKFKIDGHWRGEFRLQVLRPEDAEAAPVLTPGGRVAKGIGSGTRRWSSVAGVPRSYFEVVDGRHVLDKTCWCKPTADGRVLRHNVGDPSRFLDEDLKIA